MLSAIDDIGVELQIKRDNITLLSFLISLFVAFSVLNSYSQTTKSEKSTSWVCNNPFEQKVFVENIGQYTNQQTNSNKKILYGASSQGVNIMYTDNGIIYRYDKKETFPEKQVGKLDILINKLLGKQTIKAEQDRYVKTTPQILSMNWENASVNCKIIAEKKVNHYYAYSGTNKKANAFKKILYKNIYPNIDVEYIIPNDSVGIKYTLIIRPGGNVSDIEMKYLDAIDIKLNNKNEIEIKSNLGVITEHAPIAYYEDDNSPIDASYFLKNNKTIGFELKTTNTTDQRTIIIDPWVTTPNMSDGKAFDVNYDVLGNVYVSGEMQKVAKFNSNGILQWTYTRPCAYYSDFAVDELSSEIYLFDAPDGSINIYKLDSNGVQVDTGKSTTLVNEIWRAEFDRCNNQIIVGSGSSIGGAQAFIVDKNNLSSVIPKNIFNEADRCHDISLLAIDDDGSACYFLATESVCGNATLHNNEIVKCPLPNLTPSALTISSGFTFKEVFYLIPHYTPPALGGNSHGFNGMKVRGCYLYGYDGNTVKLWNKQNGSLVNSITVGGGLFESAGIDVDACGNIYVGNGNTIKVYDASYNLTNTISLNDTVYDIKLGLNHDIYACGNGFVEKIDLSALTINLQTVLVESACIGCNGSARAELLCNNNVSSFCTKYVWSTGDTTQTISNLCAGTYTVSVEAGCGTSYSDSITILSGTPPNITASPDSIICENTSIALSVAGALNYKWSPTNSLNDSTSATPTASPTITTSYIVTGYNSSGCIDKDTIVINVNQSPELTITTVNITCDGMCNGHATVNASSGISPYTYSWSNNSTNSSCSDLCEGTYTVTVTDAIGCSATKDTSIFAPNPITPSISNTSPTSCYGLCDGTTTAIASGGLIGSGGYSFSWNSTPIQNTASADSLCSGTYTCTVTDSNNCTATITTVINEPTEVLLSAIIAPSICIDSVINLSTSASGGNGGYSYVWSAPNDTAFSTLPNVNVSPVSATTYTVNASDIKGCLAQPVTITLYARPNVHFNANNISGCAPLCVDFIDSSTTEGASVIEWNWNYGDGSPNALSPNPSHCFNNSGEYDVTLTITDENGCSASNTINNMITAFSKPTANFTAFPNPTTTLAPTVYFTNQSSQDVIQWYWSFGDELSLLSDTANPVHNYPENTDGSYNVVLIVNNVNNCYDTTNLEIVVNPEYAFFIPNAFSPNGDGINDFFYGSGIGITIYDLWIFDRWGNMVFHSNELNKGWDGKIKNGLEVSQMDVFAWKVELNDVLGKKHSYIGTVTITR